MLAPLLAFWRSFAEVHERVAGGAGLSSRPAPLNFANGVWEPDPNRLEEAAAWCVAQGLPPAAFVDAAHPLAAAHEVERYLIATPLAAAGDAPEHRLEQVGWNHTRPLAELVGYRYDRMDVEEELSRALAGAVEREPRMEAYLAYHEGGDLRGGALALSVGERLLVVWAEARAGHDPAVSVAGRHPDREAWRIVSGGDELADTAGALVRVARIALPY